MKTTLNTVLVSVLMVASASAFAAVTDQAKVSMENGYAVSSKSDKAFSYDFAQNARDAVCTVLGPFGLRGCQAN